jgi:hypothetical protein
MTTCIYCKADISGVCNRCDPLPMSQYQPRHEDVIHSAAMRLKGSLFSVQDLIARMPHPDDDARVGEPAYKLVHNKMAKRLAKVRAELEALDREYMAFVIATRPRIPVERKVKR